MPGEVDRSNRPHESGATIFRPDRSKHHAADFFGIRQGLNFDEIELICELLVDAFGSIVPCGMWTVDRDPMGCQLP